MTLTDALRLADGVIRHEAHRHTPPGGCDHDDLAQEARVAFIRRYQRQPIPRWEVERFARVIARTAIIDHIRTLRPGKRHHHAGITLLSLDAQPRGAEEPSTLAEVTADPAIAQDSTRIDVQRKLDGLPDRERRIVMARMAGYSQADIAAPLGVTVSRVSQLLHASRRRFTSLIDQDAA